MAELQDKDWVDGTCWVEDLQWRFGWLCVWEQYFSKTAGQN